MQGGKGFVRSQGGERRGHAASSVCCLPPRIFHRFFPRLFFRSFAKPLDFARQLRYHGSRWEADERGEAPALEGRHDGILFDLDGTLWDETAVTAETWVEVARRHPGVFPPERMNREAICRGMGLTNEELARAFFPELPYETALSLMRESCELENRWLPTRGGKLYPGVVETLAALREAGRRLFVVSNAQDGYVEAFLTAHRMWDVFEDYESSGRTGCGKAENIRAVIERRGLKTPVYVGDTVSDRDGARGAGIPFVYCRYGFGETYGRGRTDDYDAALDCFSDLPAILTSLRTDSRTTEC